jgi:hypothetical protein
LNEHCGELYPSAEALAGWYPMSVDELRAQFVEAKLTGIAAHLASEELAMRLRNERRSREAVSEMERIINLGPPQRARMRHAWIMEVLDEADDLRGAADQARRVIELTGERHDLDSDRAFEILSRDAEIRGDFERAFLHYAMSHQHYYEVSGVERPADRLLRLAWLSFWMLSDAHNPCPAQTLR